MWRTVSHCQMPQKPSKPLSHPVFCHVRPRFPTSPKRNLLCHSTIKEKRELIRTFVRHVELVPEKEEVKVEFYPDHLVQSIGAGDRNRTGAVIEDRRILI